jgi:RNA polymerase sigma factor (sigma-70 family)
MRMHSESAYGTHPSLLGRLGNDPNDPEAWQAFVNRYGGLLYRWCRQWKLQECDAEDVTQNILLRIARQIRTFQYDRKRRFRGWLRVVAQAAWCDWLDDQNRVDKGTGDSAVFKFLNLVEARDDLLKSLNSEFDLELLEMASVQVRLRVDPVTWEAFRLQAYDGLSGAETATRLSINLGSAFVAKSRVRKMLQEIVRELDAEPV